MEPYSENVLWMVILGFIIAFILAFGIGANDVANSFGTSVGSGVLSLKQACILATICEVSGAVLIGYKVSDTMRKGILEVGLYENSESELMLGCVSALFSSAAWLLLATFLKLPISGTHSIVGSTIGFSLVARGTKGLKWSMLGTIVGSWFISPVLSGFVSTMLFLIIRKFILRAKEPLKNGLLSLPLFYGITVLINVSSIVLDGPKLLYMDNIPTWIAVLISVACGVIVAVLVQLCLVPMQKKKIEDKIKATDVKFTVACSNESSPTDSPKNKRKSSLVSENNQLHTIAEITELVTLNDGFGYPRNKVSYKIDPEVIKKAENLLGKSSLDNTDLTVTSLSYIDEQQNNFFNNGKNLHDRIDNNISHKIPINSNNNELINCFGDDITRSKYPNDPFLPFNKNPLKCVDSEANMNLMMLANATLSPNSSRIPLIENKNDKANKSPDTNEDNDESVSMLFSFLQILTATFGSFAHGGNDVSNAIGPLIALYMIYKEGSASQEAETPFLILIYGGIGISVGLWLWGRRVIETIGNDLTKITSSKGFTIEIGAAITVLLASKIGLPISTTHCKVGSVVFVGYISSKGNKNTEEVGAKTESSVDWHLFRNIAYAWIVTVPVTAILSAAIMYCLCLIVL